MIDKHTHQLPYLSTERYQCQPSQLEVLQPEWYAHHSDTEQYPQRYMRKCHFNASKDYPQHIE